MGFTTDPHDPRLGFGVDETSRAQNDVYLVLSDEMLARGFKRPVLRSYVHAKELGGCGIDTLMSLKIAETYAAKPDFYGATFCSGCHMHRPVGVDGEFLWIGTEQVTWEPEGPMQQSDECVTANKLKVGT